MTDKRAGRYGLLQVPTFEQAIRVKEHRINLPTLPKTEFWNSPAFQSLLNLQQNVETVAELQAREAQLQYLMHQVAQEYGAPKGHVEQLVRGLSRSGMAEQFDIGTPRGGGDNGGGGGGGPGASRRMRSKTPAGGASGSGGESLERLMRFVAEDTAKRTAEAFGVGNQRPEEAAMQTGGGGPPPSPPPGGGAAAASRRRRAPSDAMEVQVGSGGAPPPPPPGGDAVRQPLEPSVLERAAPELIRSHQAMAAQIQHMAASHAHLTDRMLDMEREVLARDAARQLHEHARSQESAAMLRAHHGALEQIGAAIGQLPRQQVHVTNSRTTNVVNKHLHLHAAAQAAASQGASSSEQVMAAARMAAEGTEAQRPDEGQLDPMPRTATQPLAIADRGRSRSRSQPAQPGQTARAQSVPAAPAAPTGKKREASVPLEAFEHDEAKEPASAANLARSSKYNLSRLIEIAARADLQPDPVPVLPIHGPQSYSKRHGYDALNVLDKSLGHFFAEYQGRGSRANSRDLTRIAERSSREVQAAAAADQSGSRPLSLSTLNSRASSAATRYYPVAPAGTPARSRSDRGTKGLRALPAPPRLVA